jgi:hypothetical protein
VAPPSLGALELAVATRQGEAALTEALRILRAIDDRYGRLDGIADAGLGEALGLQRAATRFCAAFGQLILDPQAPFTPAVFEQLMGQHRWLELLFAASGYGSADHLVALLSVGEGAGRRVPKQNLARFLLLYSAASGMQLDLGEAFAADAPVTIAAALGYLASRFCFTEAGHAFRNRLLAWLPARLGQVKLGEMALFGVASPYMHCSYATLAGKHDIKAGLMAQMRRGCLEAGAPELARGAALPSSKRPTIVVTTEQFAEGHAVWRTHSRAVAALKDAFHVVGLVHAAHRSHGVDACFDEVLTYAGEGGLFGVVRDAASQILARRPAMVLHLGVGMSPVVIALASLRLAPMQAASFGHTATTRSPAIDVMILLDDFVGDAALFSERLVRLPWGAFPYALVQGVDFAAIRARGEAAREVRRRTDGRVWIALPASVMKLGPPVFDALARAAATANTELDVEVFPLGASGLGHDALKRQLATKLPGASVNEELPYEAYLERLAACDLFVSPFPYGNMNSLVDAAMVGLTGVCLDGPEAHAHADAAYFARLGLPSALAAGNVDDYVAAIVRLADDPTWLEACRASVATLSPDHPLFTSEPEAFVEAVRALVARR